MSGAGRRLRYAERFAAGPGLEAARRHGELAKQIDEANSAYYADAPTMPDAEWDQLFRRLVALEAAWPALITPESPTQRVGAKLGETFDEVRHRRPMLSLSNAFSHDELRAFDTRVRNQRGETVLAYVDKLLVKRRGATKDTETA